MNNNKRPGHVLINNFKGPGWGGGGCLIDRRHLKERGVYSQDINKLNQTNNLWGKNIRRV